MLKDVVQHNENSIKIINTGSMGRYIGPKRRLRISKEDLVTILQKDDPNNPPSTTLFSQETQDLVKDFDMGSCVLEYRGEGMVGQLSLTLVGWRGANTLRAYTAAADTVHYLRLLGADYTKHDKNKFQKSETKTETAEGEAADMDAQTDGNQPNAAGDSEESSLVTDR
ncbi:unnamed protein product [Leptidea sinapis]|uniref:RNA cytosine-C(5)-methyltransferase NSUN2-like PUA domain-containing protein n=1 Tax=Leptidea sinapis TaxID=189913 RepID=A0A5E4QR23_9NEOP|nr:unnamed protein product [Leptidea sinapis]